MSSRYYTKNQALSWAADEAKKKYEEKRKINEKSRKTAFRHYTPWTREELVIVSQWSGSDVELAEKLSRTVSAVQSRRAMIQFCQKNSQGGK